MKKKIVSLLLLFPLLSGCQSSIPLKVSIYNEYLPPVNTFEEVNNDVYYQNKKINTLHVNYIDGVGINTGIYDYSSLEDVHQGLNKDHHVLLSNDLNNPNSYIRQKLLVVPVYFSDSDTANNVELQENKKILLRNAFFGKSEVTNYESVASFYNKSSYGHLRIEGEVTDWLDINIDGHFYSSNEARNEGSISPENFSDKVIKMIVERLDGDLIKHYCKNHNDVIDALYIIYDFPYESDKKNNENSLFWAYTYQCKSTPVVSSYSWSSYYFVGEKALENHYVNANTYIHEVGHLLGLSDYYNKGGYHFYQPLGFMDMMDYNLGDHTPLSKYLLNWTSPYILKNSGTISLKPFSLSGDFILIPKENYNQTPFDRYLLVSFFSPQGLSKLNQSSTYIYTNKNGEQKVFNYPQDYGVLVYEVDARLGYYSYNSIRQSSPKCFINENPGYGDYVINFYHDNEINNENDAPLYHLLESSGINSFKDGNGASRDTLFKYNSTFGVDTYKDLANEFNVSFKVSKLTTSEVEITFTKTNRK